MKSFQVRFSKSSLFFDAQIFLLLQWSTMHNQLNVQKMLPSIALKKMQKQNKLLMVGPFMSLLSPQVTVLASCLYLPRQEITLDNSSLFYSLAAVNYVFVDVIWPKGRIQWTVFYNQNSRRGKRFEVQAFLHYAFVFSANRSTFMLHLSL